MNKAASVLKDLTWNCYIAIFLSSSTAVSLVSLASYFDIAAGCLPYNAAFKSTLSVTFFGMLSSNAFMQSVTVAATSFLSLSEISTIFFLKTLKVDAISSTLYLFSVNKIASSNWLFTMVELVFNIGKKLFDIWLNSVLDLSGMSLLTACPRLGGLGIGREKAECRGLLKEKRPRRDF